MPSPGRSNYYGPMGRQERQQHAINNLMQEADAALLTVKKALKFAGGGSIILPLRCLQPLTGYTYPF